MAGSQDLPGKLQAKASGSKQMVRKLDSLLHNDVDSDGDMRAQDEIKRIKYAPQKALGPGAKATFKKKLIKRKIRAIYEKQKADQKEKQSVKMRR